MEHRRTVRGVYAGVHGYTDTGVQGDRGVGEGGKGRPTMLGGIAGWMLACIQSNSDTWQQGNRYTGRHVRMGLPGCGETCHRCSLRRLEWTRVGM